MFYLQRSSHQISCYARAWLLQKGFPDFTKKLRPSRFFLHSSVTSVGMVFTKDLSTLDIKTFPLHVFFAERAVKTLRVVVAVEGLDPAIPSLNGKTTSDTLRCEQLVPILLAVREAVLQIEWEVGKDFAAVGAAEALRMEVGAKSLQTILSVHFGRSLTKDLLTLCYTTEGGATPTATPPPGLAGVWPSG